MDNVFIVTSVVAATEFLRRVHVTDWYGAITIVVAGLIGFVAGILGAPGVGDAWSGIVAGLGASGIVTVAQKINQGTTTIGKTGSR